MNPMFKRSDALILGYVISQYFCQPVTITQQSNNQISQTDWGFVIGNSSGDGAGGGINGDQGKLATDDHFPDINMCTLSGSGATPTTPGGGFYAGSFGLGGGQYSLAGLPSCGGGSGWFGGGSSFAGAGGGGGSGFVLVTGAPVPTGYTPPNQSYYATNPQYITGSNAGNGKVKINGLEFDYTGKVQTYTVPTSGNYLIECYGAQGGGEDQLNDKYSGGLGGYTSGVFSLNAGQVLYIYVGQEGQLNDQIGAWNGGGIGSGGCYGGGGSSDVRWSGTAGSQTWSDTLYDRFIVAGGGGGQGSINRSSSFNNAPSSTNVSPSENNNVTDSISTQNNYYLVNDLSVAKVGLAYATTNNLPTNPEITINLIVDGATADTITVTPTAGGGMLSVSFNFSDFLALNTPAHWSQISVGITSNLPFISIPPKGLVLTIFSNLRVNDNTSTPKPVSSQTYGVFKVEKVTLTDMSTLDLFNEANSTDNVYDTVQVTDSISVDLYEPPNEDYIVDTVLISDTTVLDFIITNPTDSLPSDAITITDTSTLDVLVPPNIDANTDTVTVTDTYTIDNV